MMKSAARDAIDSAQLNYVAQTADHSTFTVGFSSNLLFHRDPAQHLKNIFLDVHLLKYSYLS